MRYGTGKLSSASPRMIPQFTDPLFQNQLVVRLGSGENDSHMTFRCCVSHFAASREGAAFVGHSDSQLSSYGKSFTRGHTTAKEAQIDNQTVNLDLGLQIEQFGGGRKGVTARPWAFAMNLDRILNFVDHTFIVRNDSRNRRDISIRCIHAIIGPLPLLVWPSPIGVRLRPLRIYKVLNDGALQFVEAIQTLDGASERVRELGKLWPGEYVIENGETGERVFVNTRDETK